MKTVFVVTHDKLFHADEVSAVALLKIAFPNTNFEVIRTRDEDIIREFQAIDDVFVIDVGLVYDEDKLNFDHHQDIKGLPASNILILNFIKNYISSDSNKLGELKFNVILSRLKPLFDGISNIDVNKDGILGEWNKFNKDKNLTHLSQIISSFNIDPDSNLQDARFNQVVDLMVTIINNEIVSIHKKIEDLEKVWAKKEEIAGGKGLFFDEFCSVWKEEVEYQNLVDIKLAVMPTGSSPDGSQKWGVISINTDVFVIPSEEKVRELMTNPEDLIFVHGSGFTSGFKTKESALEVAQKIV